MRAGPLVDAQGRSLRDLRVSLTDRCNCRCLYCLPETEAAQDYSSGSGVHRPGLAPLGRHRTARSTLQPRGPRSHLSFEEIERVARIAAGLGVRKLRLTGGEPLLCRGVEKLVTRLARLPGLADLAMTTNGLLFASRARALRGAGLRRVSFSLDSLDRDTFRKITGRDGLNDVLRSIELAQRLGFQPVKINAVIIRDLNDHEITSLAAFARDHALSVRFIEFMPLDAARAWRRERVVTGSEILQRLRAAFDLCPVAPGNPSATARRWTFAEGRGEIGIIAPVSEPFCDHCQRLRLTADGRIRTCLFSVIEHDLRPLLRNGASDNAIAEWLCGVVSQKEPRHHIGEAGFVPPPRSMSCIGG